MIRWERKRGKGGDYINMFRVYILYMTCLPTMKVYSVLKYVWKSILKYLCVYVCVDACSPMHTRSCLTLCNPTDGNPRDSSVHGIFQAKILERITISFYRDLPNPGIESVSLTSPALAGRFFTSWATREALWLTNS